MYVEDYIPFSQQKSYQKVQEKQSFVSKKKTIA